MEKNKNSKLKIAALGDIHVKETSVGAFKLLFDDISEKADILVLCGDLTDRGLPHEAEILATELQALRIPAIGVLGNHDYESNKVDEIKSILTQARMIILGEDIFEFKGVGFAGTKGFAGGFEKFMLSSFGEEGLKQFVQEAVNEELILENALTRLSTEKKVVLLHYAPIRETLKGEPLEIFPFLGSSRLVSPIDQYDVNAVFHGHAHHGAPYGKTLKGIPVYNVAYPLMQKEDETRPYALVEI